MDVIKQIQQAIVYIEDRLLEPFNLQELSDYVGLSPYHLEQSFKMIVGQSPEQYARARRMTIAATDVMHGASRLMDVAKKYRYANSNEFANDFSDFHGISPIQASTKKDELKFQERLYIKLSTTERAPYTYRLQETEDISLVGYSRFIPTKDLSNPFNVPDFLEDLLVEGLIKELRRYNDVSPYELFVVSCPLDQGLELFVGVPSERYPAHLESRFLPGRHYATFNLQGEIDYATNEAWYYIESSLQLTLPYERNSLYVEVYPFDISFDDPFTKIQLWLPIKQEAYDFDELD
ncbi:effector binding domain-containing protein [Staphylococcus capitis]|uniref:AraC family transcriptional regulator n=1 Tax=Staphylococcus capitis TaxID=29388 RepID=A0A0S4M3Z9_STACP|nr:MULTISPECIES: AraC family transcriptional regulator [Staphylococcus]MBW4836989.1 AraC family transcriptional regulator [Staphylococcaceae bacterium]AKL91954.1 Multiple antibiotic resistance protein MarA [Staphylococcus capitis subsp. capitis]EEE49567.1 transcriptional regulator, effector binding domain protein [Staphylococcus capitis SK14]EGS37519.1 transcriptional regulator, effector binding domain protein [Staphylococcus capitis VCU116]KDE96303.1 AraC family transcriptional regulator [Sta